MLGGRGEVSVESPMEMENAWRSPGFKRGILFLDFATPQMSEFPGLALLSRERQTGSSGRVGKRQ